MGTQIPWESVTAFVALGAFGYSCTAILGYDDVVFEGEGEDADAGAAGTSHLDTDCIPAEGKEPVADECGLFVSAKLGDDVDGDGSKARPLRTVGKALQNGNILYTCTGDVIDEAVVVDGEATLFGGLDCDSGWAFASGSKTTWTAPAGSVPLRVAEGGRAQLRDMTVTARDAASAGGSSIAVIAGPKSTLDLARCDVAAGDAKDGASPGEVAGEGLSGVEGGKGTAGCLTPDPATPPGLGGQHGCELLDVGGGSGGPGLLGSAGADGSDGSPAVGGQTSGDGGKKQDVTDCTAGHAGAVGAKGESGAGATGLGSVGAEGFAGSEGADGAAGKPGQGGGGGGGAKKCGNGKAGPSGGGGGSGACGGGGGRGGGAGGASIGIVSLDATLTLTEVTIRTGHGGKGSAGASGGPGGEGAAGGPPGAGDSKAKACAGGKGGDGGKGGRGGGGRGGHSIGVAHVGAVPLLAGVEVQIGAAGDGGQGEGLTGDGAPGVSAPAQGFD